MKNNACMPNFMSRHVQLHAWKYHVAVFTMLAATAPTNNQPVSGSIKDKIKSWYAYKAGGKWFMQSSFLSQLWARWHIHPLLWMFLLNSCNVCGCYSVCFFMFSNFCWLDLHNETCVGLANLRWNFSKNWIENWTLSDLVMVVGSACLVSP